MTALPPLPAQRPRSAVLDAQQQADLDRILEGVANRAVAAERVRLLAGIRRTVIATEVGDALLLSSVLDVFANGVPA